MSLLLFVEGRSKYRIALRSVWHPVPFPESNLFLTACWACDDFTLESGATTVVPGSASFRRPPNMEEVASMKGFRLSVKRGRLLSGTAGPGTIMRNEPSMVNVWFCMCLTPVYQCVRWRFILVRFKTGLLSSLVSRWPNLWVAMTSLQSLKAKPIRMASCGLLPMRAVNERKLPANEITKIKLYGNDHSPGFRRLCWVCMKKKWNIRVLLFRL